VGITNEISAGVDIDLFVHPFDKFYFVRLTDLMTNYKPNKRFGADIDAVVALGSLKGMFETTAEYQKRLNDSLSFATQNLKDKAIQIIANKKAILKYVDFIYDADKSLVTLNTPNIKGLTFSLKRDKAKEFYKNITQLEILDPDFTVDCSTGKFVLQKAALKNIKSTIAYTAPDYISKQPLTLKNTLASDTQIKQTKPEINKKEDTLTTVIKVDKSADFNTKNIKSQTLKIGQRFALPNLYFSPDSYSLTKTAKRTLLRLQKFLKENPLIKIEIEGHTNTLPPHEYSNKLSTNRAKNVASFLFEKGIPKSQITYKGYGKRRPIDTSNNEQARLQNQRVEIKVIAVE